MLRCGRDEGPGERQTPDKAVLDGGERALSRPNGPAVKSSTLTLLLILALSHAAGAPLPDGPLNGTTHTVKYLSAIPCS
jgi:hypothetical protein